MVEETEADGFKWVWHWAYMGALGLLWFRWRNEIDVWLDEAPNSLGVMAFVCLLASTRWMPPTVRRLIFLPIIGAICAGLIYAHAPYAGYGLPLLKVFPYTIYLLALTFGICLFLEPRSRHFYFVLGVGGLGALLLEVITLVHSVGMQGFADIFRFLFVENLLATLVVFFLPLLGGIWGLWRFIAHRRGGY